MGAGEAIPVVSQTPHDEGAQGSNSVREDVAQGMMVKKVVGSGLAV